jgi:hypothetical protein
MSPREFERKIDNAVCSLVRVGLLYHMVICIYSTTAKEVVCNIHGVEESEALEAAQCLQEAAISCAPRKRLLIAPCLSS